jgi:small subunit ribosomal protein S9
MSTQAFNSGTGRRKTAVARVRLLPGEGEIVINGRSLAEHFGAAIDEADIRLPFRVTNTDGRYNAMIKVEGGGVTGQAGAVKHGIAQALSRFEPALRTMVKQAGFLTRDPRVVERKKYGRAKARRSFQFSKR